MSRGNTQTWEQCYTILMKRYDYLKRYGRTTRASREKRALSKVCALMRKHKLVVVDTILGRVDQQWEPLNEKDLEKLSLDESTQL